MKWLIWSTEHNAWWAANSNGYVFNRSKAGKYDFEEACKIVSHSNAYCKDKGPPEETMVKCEEYDNE